MKRLSVECIKQIHHLMIEETGGMMSPIFIIFWCNLQYYRNIIPRYYV